jgi:hypothetical protein
MHKIVIRSIFYHWLFLFAGVVIGFISNSEYVGEKSVIIERSINNIFFPIKYNEKIEAWIKETGRMRLWANLNCPEHFEIVDEVVKGEEYYWAIYKMKDKSGKEIKDIGSIKVKWKTWEYHYKLDEIIEGSEIKKLD